MTGGTNWTRKEELCLAYQQGKAARDLTFEAWCAKRQQHHLGLHEPPDVAEYALMFELGRTCKLTLWEALNSPGIRPC
jgi:hypothetical protein